MKTTIASQPSSSPEPAAAPAAGSGRPAARRACRARFIKRRIFGWEREAKPGAVLRRTFAFPPPREWVSDVEKMTGPLSVNEVGVMDPGWGLCFLYGISAVRALGVLDGVRATGSGHHLHWDASDGIPTISIHSARLAEVTQELLACGYVVKIYERASSRRCGVATTGGRG